MKRLTLPRSRCLAAALAAVLCLWGQPLALAQDMPPPAAGASRGENFSAQSPVALFASDCTGAGCHKGPQGLDRSVGIGGLAGFLREHYTNSRESAAALANYLSKIPSGPEPRDARAPRGGRPTAAAPSEARAPRPTPPGGTSRASVRLDEDPAAVPPAAMPPAPKPNPSPTARPQRSRQPTAATAVAPALPPLPEAAPAPPPLSEAAPAPPPSAAPPPPKEFDIFD